MAVGSTPGSHGDFGPVRSARAEAPPTSHRHHRLVRAARIVGLVVGCLVLSVVALLVAVLVHLNTSTGRRFAVDAVNRILAPSFRGEIRVERLGGVGLFGLSGADATIYDPSGRPALVVRGARVRIATLAAARSALFGSKRSPLIIELPVLSIERLDVRLDTDANGNLDLLDAFESKSPPTPTDPNARGLRLVISRMDLGHGWAHGVMAGAPPIDADLDDFGGALTYAPDLLEGDIARATLAARHLAAGADVRGSLRAHVKKPSDPKANLGARFAWEGLVGGIAQSINASLDENKVDAVIDVPGASPENIRTLWPASPINERARGHLEAHGTLPDVAVDLRGGLGEAAFGARANVFVGAEKRVKLTVEARNVDVHEFAPSAPESRLGLTGDASADVKANGALTADVAFRFLGGSLGNYGVPTAAIRASASRASASDLRAHAAITIDEPTTPTQLTVDVSPQGGSSNVDFDLHSEVPNFDKVPQLRHQVHGSARLAANGTLDVAKMSVEAQLQLNIERFLTGNITVGSASISARASGRATDPGVDLVVHSRGVTAGGLHMTSADVRVTGEAMQPHVAASVRSPDRGDIDGSVDVGLRPSLSLRAVHVALARAGERALVTAEKVSVAGSDIRVDGARIDGLGSPLTATLAMSTGALRLQAATEGIDLGRVGRLAHLEKNLQSGLLVLDADMTLERDTVRGRGKLDLTRGAMGGVKEVAAHADVSLKGRRFVGTLHVQGAEVGGVDIATKGLELGGGGPFSVESWRQAFGAVDVDAHADLGKIATLLPPERMPLHEASGEVTIKGHIARDDARDFTPDVTLTVRTDQLVLAPPTKAARDIDGVLVMPLPAWRLLGIDFDIDTFVDGDNGATRLAAKLHDSKGALAEIEFRAPHVPFANWLGGSNGRKPIATDFRNVPFELKVTTPERGLGGLPAILKQEYLGGKFQAELNVKGTALDPNVDLEARVHNAKLSAISTSAPLDGDLSLKYDGQRAKASLKARAADRDLLVVESQVDAIARQFLAGDAANAPWEASARAHMSQFPMGEIAFLDDKLVSGLLSGDMTLDNLHKDAKARADLTIDSLKVGNVAYKAAQIRFTADGHVLDAIVHVDEGDGAMEAKAHGLASWGTAMAPTLVQGKPLDASLSAQNFRISGLLPFVEGTFDELDGRLDAATNIQLDPQSRTARLSGTMALTHGVFEAVAGGGEFHDVGANLRFSPDGTITVEKLNASGMSGRLEANATAHLKGTALESAKAVVVIPSNAAIPVTAAGSEIGNVDGRFDVTASSPDGKALDIKVDVPHVRVALPEGSTNKAQSLGDIPKVHVGAHRGHPAKFVEFSLDSKREEEAASQAKAQSSSSVATTIRLGDVQIVRGKDLKVGLDGNLQVKPGAPSPVSGQIQLKPGGSLIVQGKKFTIENGTVTFVGSDASNPEVVVKAGWKAPEGTTVYATFVGPLRTGKVTLSSEPPLGQQEIVSLLLFGTPDGQTSSGQHTDTTVTAAAAAGGEAAQPLNHALGQLGLDAVTAKVDTSGSAPKPEVQIQVANDISLQLAMVLGQINPGVNPDRTLVTLEWRFISRWSLATTVGNAGTTIFDLLWQKRY
ncbi:MAG: translocation/assembly module TamB [Myxococcota bacterium]|nr:translocation/assembly module TamB [Myxococcota bacterium]